MIERVEYLDQLPEWCSVFFQDTINYENSDLVIDPDSQKVFQQFLDELENVEEWNKDVFMAVMKSVQKKTGVKGKNLWMPVRLALTGKEHGPELPRVVELLGKEKCKKFLTLAIQYKG